MLHLLQYKYHSIKIGVLPYWIKLPGFYLRVCNRKIVFLFLNQNICCGYSKEPSEGDGSFEHPKHMLEIMGKKRFTILCWKFLFKPVVAIL